MLEENLTKFLKLEQCIPKQGLISDKAPASCRGRYPVCSGGIIYDVDTNRVLVVKGFEKWSLPKGHREWNEEPYQTAMREIYEETSLRVVIMPYDRPQRILKSHYYPIMVQNGAQLKIAPIDTHEVKDVRWCSIQELMIMPCNKQLRSVINRWDSIKRWFFTRGSYGYVGPKPVN